MNQHSFSKIKIRPLKMNLNQTFYFLKQIRQNNNREWFNEHKDLYLSAKDDITGFSKLVFDAISVHDQIDESKNKIYRIFRDVRFGKDKTPFKSNWSGAYQRLGANRRGGYFFSIEPGNTQIGGGFFGPSPQDLLHIRKQISHEPETLKAIISDSTFVETFGELQGDQVKTTPKGFDKEDPAIELLRYKQMIVRHRFTDEEVASKDFALNVSNTFSKMRPFFDYMTEILITDLNGVSLI
jgi:uncharacterized protein (TIGR02453 family)